MALNASKSAITASLSGTQTINGHTLDALESGYRSRQIATYGRAGLGFAGAVQNTFNAGMQLRELALQGRELDADIRQAIGIYTAQANQFQTEHIYNERNFALQLMKVGNVFQQGEVNDRDVTDQYNDKKGLKEVHLIYRVPSRVQKEGLKRYYKLYGSNCQIPDVEFKFNKYLREGEIWQFGFIDSITNLWATEEKEVLKSVFANGIKILSLSKVVKPNLLPSVKPWQTKIDELLSEATAEEKNVLFNKLTIGLDQPEIIKHLAEHTVDKNSLVPIITQFLDKESLLAKLAESDDKEHLTKFVLKLLDRIDQDELFNEILRHKDKEKLVEQWIEGGSQLMRTLWDKYPEHTVSRDEHTEVVSSKNKTIEEKDAQLQEDQKQITTLTRRIGDLNQKIDKASSKARIDNITILNQREQYSLQAKELLKEKSKSRQLATEKEEKEREVATVTDKLNSTQSELQIAKGSIQKLTGENAEKDKELATNKEKLEKVKKEKEALTLQYDTKLKEAEQSKKELEECQKSLEAVRQIEQRQESKVDNVFLNYLVKYYLVPNLDTYSQPIYYMFNVGSIIELYQWDSSLCCYYLTRSASTLSIKKLWGASAKYWGGQSWDLQRFWKFDSDSFKNDYIAEFWVGGHTTDENIRINGSGDYASYSQAVYIGDWKVIYVRDKWYPRVKNQPNVSGYTIDTLELVDPIYYSKTVGLVLNRKDDYREIRLYKDYLDLLGMKWDKDKNMAVPKD